MSDLIVWAPGVVAFALFTICLIYRVSHSPRPAYVRHRAIILVAGDLMILSSAILSLPSTLTDAAAIVWSRKILMLLGTASGASCVVLSQFPLPFTERRSGQDVVAIHLHAAHGGTHALPQVEAVEVGVAAGADVGVAAGADVDAAAGVEASVGSNAISNVDVSDNNDNNNGIDGNNNDNGDNDNDNDNDNDSNDNNDNSNANSSAKRAIGSSLAILIHTLVMTTIFLLVEETAASGESFGHGSISNRFDLRPTTLGTVLAACVLFETFGAWRDAHYRPSGEPPFMRPRIPRIVAGWLGLTLDLALGARPEVRQSVNSSIWTVIAAVAGIAAITHTYGMHIDRIAPIGDGAAGPETLPQRRYISSATRSGVAQSIV